MGVVRRRRSACGAGSPKIEPPPEQQIRRGPEPRRDRFGHDAIASSRGQRLVAERGSDATCGGVTRLPVRDAAATPPARRRASWARARTVGPTRCRRGRRPAVDAKKTRSPSRRSRRRRVRRPPTARARFAAARRRLPEDVLHEAAAVEAAGIDAAVPVGRPDERPRERAAVGAGRGGRRGRRGASGRLRFRNRSGGCGEER